MLEVSNLSAGYDAKAVVLDVSVNVREGEAVAIIGSNGAGKTTLLRAICGLLPVSSGNVQYAGTSITNLAVHEIARSGIAFVPAQRHLFPEMTVAENLALGAFPHRPDPDQHALVLDLFPRLAERRHQAAGTMSGGEQQMLAVGRALMANPQLLILDEPTTGLAPRLAAQAYESLAALRGQGMTILVAEQQVPLVLGIADRGYVLENGEIQLEGLASDLRGNPTVQRAYLGVV
ncbi:MAG: ABC transporter ATP-binding protein [Actinobacteria bacterium]|nr:ABC transporter ATP-binding protein [Actinomycetota bacterium]